MPKEARTQEEANTQHRAQILGLQYIDTSNVSSPKLYRQLLSNQELYRLRVIPILADDNSIIFGVTNTTSQHTMKSLQERFLDQRVSFGLISETGFNDYMKQYDPPPEVVYQDIAIKASSGEELKADLDSISKMLAKVRSDDMLAYLVKQAYQLKASDIHLETKKDKVKIRFRVDGVLHPVAELTTDKYRLLLSSLASAANISAAGQEAQTGHIERTYTLADMSQVTVNLRVETVPTIHGQDGVLRLFNFKTDYLQLDKLGFSKTERAIIDDILTHPSGLVLIVGPTGSGKTTTLYSLISELNNPERKIITLEDPVEYVIDGITQIPVDSRKEDQGFAEKLRSVLRLDPDIIMVGEIRDLDTAKTALQSSLTGHLVLSTYHASTAAAALTRMLDAVGENPLFINTIRLITAMRLVRRLDDATKQAYHPDDATKEHIKEILSNLPASVEKPSLDNITLYRPGTSKEYPFGYNGQLSIRELMQMTPELQKILRRPAHDISTVELEEAARQGGMITMLQSGILKALAGETTLEEIFRVVG
jgi:type II secretory ATPase GspE/PulE/Tfp pilus assembly ATPase PilB-like protein